LWTLPRVFATEIGFAVAYGVLVDNLHRQLVLVTALNMDVGRSLVAERPAPQARGRLDQGQAEPASVTR
jgi:putative drug exporter of the RND superfamily